MPTPLEKCENLLLASKYRAEKIKEKFNLYYTLKPGLQLNNEGNPELKKGYSFGKSIHGPGVKDRKIIVKNETLKSSSKIKRKTKKKKSKKKTKQRKTAKTAKTATTTKKRKKRKTTKRKSSNKKKN